MVVLDASVVVKWVLRDEVGAAEALEWRERHRSGMDRVAVPEMLFYEVANAIVWSGRIEPALIEECWVGLLAVGLAVYVLRGKPMLRAIELARVAQTSVYDACYVALAETLECDLVTADAKLARKLRGHDVACDVRTL